MKAILLVFVIAMVRGSFGVIYSLNESEYNRMPSLYALDDYSSCMLEADAAYCVADFKLFTNTDSDLMNMIQEYSAQTVKHFNHTQIHRGVCVKKTCANYIKNRSLNETAAIGGILEECLNNSIWDDYKLQVKLQEIRYCKRGSDKIAIDGYDVFVAAIYIIIITLNIVGSFYDIIACKNGVKQGNPYLLAFSVRRNWNKLVTPSGQGSEPRLEILKCFHGFRTMTMICVFFSHTVLIMAYSYVDNPLYIEKSYEDPVKQILFNGSLVTHTFFVMSSFLMAYNLQLYAEKHQIGWLQIPKGILIRWIRLTPTYAVILATICTWMRHLSTGPLWDHVVGTEAEACRTYWWAHLLYINNYFYDDAYCAPQTWYLAADTQMFCFALFLCILFRGRARWAALGVTLAAAIAALALHTYYQDLEAVVIQTPETYRELYAHDDTFRLLYIRGHTNLSTYVLGLGAGFLAYYLQNKGKDFSKHKGYRWAYWAVFPLGVGVILSGGAFYGDGARAPPALRVAYAALYKPIFQLLVLIIAFGTMFKLETLYRGILEWRGWTWMGRVSYSAFLLHTLFQRGFVGVLTRPIYLSDSYVMTMLSATVLLSYVCACALWLCVEAPVAAAARAAFAPPNTRERDPPRHSLRHTH